MYPAGASSSGALDMAGNVWKWASNLADDSAAYARLDAEPKDFAVLLGGSWFSARGEVSGVVRRAHLPTASAMPSVSSWSARLAGRISGRV